MRIILCGRTWHDRYGGEGGVLTEHVSGAQGGGRILFRFSKPKHSLKTLIHNVSWRVSGRRSVQKSTVYLPVLECSGCARSDILLIAVLNCRVKLRPFRCRGRARTLSLACGTRTCSAKCNYNSGMKNVYDRHYESRSVRSSKFNVPIYPYVSRWWSSGLWPVHDSDVSGPPFCSWPLRSSLSQARSTSSW